MMKRKMLTLASVIGIFLLFATACEDLDFGRRRKKKLRPVTETPVPTTPTTDTTQTTPTTGTTDTTTTTGSTGSTGSTSTANLIFLETVEGSNPFSTAHSWDVGDWDYALQFVPSPAYAGSRSARFEIREDQPLVSDGKRSEITIVKGSAGDIQKDTWYSFAVYFPSLGYEYDSEREVINQWYQSGSPATSLRTHKDRIVLESGNTSDNRKQYDMGPIVKDKWHTVVIHFIHSYGSDGLIEFWYDGEKKITLNGGNMYDDVLPKWKIGLYKSAFKYNTSDVTRRIIYYDNIKVGNGTSTYETMKP